MSKLKEPSITGLAATTGFTTTLALFIANEYNVTIKVAVAFITNHPFGKYEKLFSKHSQNYGTKKKLVLSYLLGCARKSGVSQTLIRVISKLSQHTSKQAVRELILSLAKERKESFKTDTPMESMENLI